MNQDVIKKELISLLAELFTDTGIDTDLFEYVDLIDDLGMDSVTFISIIVEVEARFGITVPDDKLLMEEFKNVDSIISIVLNELNEKSNAEGNAYV